MIDGGDVTEYPKLQLQNYSSTRCEVIEMKKSVIKMSLENNFFF